MKYNYIQTFRWIYSRLQPHRKKQFWIFFAIMAFADLLETAALGKEVIHDLSFEIEKGQTTCIKDTH